MSERARNVLLITTDQQRADSLGAYGNPVCQTPNLDRLADEGTSFTACRTQNPFCQPSRATILTGTYPSTHGVVFNGRDLPDEQLARSFAGTLSQAGFETSLFGKAHFAVHLPLPSHRQARVGGGLGFDARGMDRAVRRVRPCAADPLRPHAAGGPADGLVELGVRARAVRPALRARFLHEQSVEHGKELLRLMQPEAAGARWDDTQTWRNEIPEELHPTTWTADRAVEWISQRPADGRPWMSWVSFTDPHHPMDPPGRWFDMYSPDDVREVLPVRDPDELEGKPPLQAIFARGSTVEEMRWANPGGGTYSDHDLARMIAGYYAMVSQLDHNIGRILDALQATGQAEDTLVIMTTDHGEHLGDHSQIFKSPIHYDGILRLPLIVRGPGFEPGAVVDDPVGTIDLAPTIFEATGVPAPDHLEGRSLRDLDREWTLTEDDFDIAIGDGLRIPLRTICTHRWKINVYLEGPWGELYDLVDDPGEIVNRWDDPSCAAIKDELLGLVKDQTRFSPVILPAVGLVA